MAFPDPINVAILADHVMQMREISEKVVQMSLDGAINPHETKLINELKHIIDSQNDMLGNMTENYIKMDELLLLTAEKLESAVRMLKILTDEIPDSPII